MSESSNDVDSTKPQAIDKRASLLASLTASPSIEDGPPTDPLMVDVTKQNESITEASRNDASTATESSFEKPSLLTSLTATSEDLADPLSGRANEKIESEVVPKLSSLSKSALLSFSVQGDLFDSVDADLKAREEEEELARQETERLREEEEERQRASKIKAEQEAAELQHRQQVHHQPQLLQQQQIDQGMQNLQLNGYQPNFGTVDANFGVGNSNSFYRPSPQQQQAQAAKFGNGNNSRNVNVTAGMHNSITKKVVKAIPSDIPKFTPLHGPIRVTDPLLYEDDGLFSGPPHWTYVVTVKSLNKIDGTEYSTTNQVRRRFRHFVALEKRLRNCCLGAILPPRPEKHANRAIEEGTSHQSVQFAHARANELEIYLNALRHHPIAGVTSDLKLFLNLPEDIGTAWPEVSTSVFTRFQETASKISEATAEVFAEINRDHRLSSGEDSADMLELGLSEELRMGHVIQAVPQLQGTMALFKEYGDLTLALGLEFSLIKTVLTDEHKDMIAPITDEHKDMIAPIEILSDGLIRSGKRTKRLAVEISASMVPFITQYRLCRYERMAFDDRRTALQKRHDEREKANAHAKKLILHQQQQNTQNHAGNIQELERLETAAAIYDDWAHEANKKSEEIASTIKSEVNRNTVIRRSEWSASIKIIAANMKEGYSEKIAIWENSKKMFLEKFPDMEIVDTSSSMPPTNTDPVLDG